MDTVARLLSADRSMVSPKVGKDFHRGQYKKGKMSYLTSLGGRENLVMLERREDLLR